MESSGEPVISVVLSTYNRASLLGGALRSLLAPDPAVPRHEVIVVDNNSTDGTRAVVESLVSEGSGRLRYVFEARQGLSHARNRGIAASRGQYIAFTDDDVRATPGWLGALTAAFEAHPEVAFVGGRVLPNWPHEPPAWLTREHWGPLALVDHGDAGFVTSLRRPITLVGANMAYRRGVFAEFGGFDPHYQHQPGAVSSVEDHEFERRLYQAGHQGWYEPAAVVEAAVQPDRLTKAYHRRWHYDHGRNLVRLLPAGHVYDPNMIPRLTRPGDRHLLGAPLYLFRGIGERTVALAAATVRGRTAAALRAECEMRAMWGSLRLFAAARRDPSVRAGGGRAHPRIEEYGSGRRPAFDIRAG
jgi:glycosyltransferase involved in cell wall biosynthesis